MRVALVNQSDEKQRINEISFDAFLNAGISVGVGREIFGRPCFAVIDVALHKQEKRS